MEHGADAASAGHETLEQAGARRLKKAVAVGSLVLVGLQILAGVFFFGGWAKRMEALEAGYMTCMALVERVSFIEGRLGVEPPPEPPEDTDGWSLKERFGR